MLKDKQMSETLWVGVILASVGGFLDAYTYLIRGGVFANAQTGNIVLLGVHFFEGNMIKAGTYVIPILAFVGGILIAEIIKKKYKSKTRIHWRQIILGIEIIILCIVGFMPHKLNQLANLCVAFVCALQVESFRKLEGSPYTTTMCTGNLRSGTEAFYQYIGSKDKKLLYKSLKYFMVIFCFIAGAGLGVIATLVGGLKSIFVAPLLLGVVVLIMHPWQR